MKNTLTVTQRIDHQDGDLPKAYFTFNGTEMKEGLRSHDQIDDFLKRLKTNNVISLAQSDEVKEVTKTFGIRTEKPPKGLYFDPDKVVRDLLDSINKLLKKK